SQVFLQALSAMPRYRNGSFRAWLFTIAAHVIADKTRRQIRAVSLDALEGVEESITDPGPDPEALVLVRETDQSISSLLLQLPPQQQRVVELRLAGLTGPEIATVLGMTMAGVRSTQYRAYSRLRTLMHERMIAKGSDT
ncbi:MAG: RNA polymerase sigma factor, partial [Thermomicrobiales bacterium]